MWIERLLYGVLQVLTPLGPRYLSPSFLERVYLLWTFRNFNSLPVVVLNHRQQKLVDQLCSQQKFVSLSLDNGMFDPLLIGTVEHLSPGHSETETPAEGALNQIGTTGPLPIPALSPSLLCTLPQLPRSGHLRGISRLNDRRGKTLTISH